MLRVTMQADTKDAVALLENLASGMQDFSPVWPTVERIIMDMEKDQFRTKGEWGGEEWEPLNETYAAWKEKVYGTKEILVRTGTLFGSLTTKGQGHYYNAGPNFVEVGTTVPYAGFHQRGHDRPTRLPKRVVVPTPPQPTAKAIADAIMAFLILKMRNRRR